MDGRDIICIMPTGQWDFSSPDGYMDETSFRGREVAHIPATCDANARLYAGDFASCIAHERSDTAFAREPESVKLKLFVALLMMFI
jgi:hypothetical protein